jgi:hypothetical protein
MKETMCVSNMDYVGGVACACASQVPTAWTVVVGGTDGAYARRGGQ